MMIGLCVAAVACILLATVCGSVGMQHVAVVLCLILYLYVARGRTAAPPRLSKEDTFKLVRHRGHVFVSTMLDSEHYYFMLDTGYAGAPVINLRYIDACSGQRLSIPDAIQRVQRSKRVPWGRVQDFVRRHRCHDFTAGCTMRLMSIGASTQRQTDLFLCNALHIETATSSFSNPKLNNGLPNADAFVTNDIPSTLHILTMDYLLPLAPFLLSVNSLALRTCIPAAELAGLRRSYAAVQTSMRSGSFVVRVKVGGVWARCSIDTGAPACVSIDAKVAQRVKACSLAGKTVRQMGVNGESVCSSLTYMDVEMGGTLLPNVPVLVNDRSTGEVDGYIGTGLLQAFDLLFVDVGVLLVRPSGAAAGNGDLAYANGKCTHDARLCKKSGNGAGVRLLEWD